METPNQLPDSTDWILTSLSSFEPLEAALRCEVCKEFYYNPVVTTCSHTFCSLCIRRCLAADGKCPACKSACQADKLQPNIAVREIVARFQEARPKALELARADKEESQLLGSGKKRKLEETDIEQEGPARQTRVRQTRSSRRGDSQRAADAAVVIPHSEDDQDADYTPEGMAKCPICNDPMKEALVFDHVAVCTGESTAGRTTRSRKNDAFTSALQRRPIEPTPSMARLSGLNYAMLSETALRKKLKELGIPQWGSKPLLIRRHQEWMNIFNSNCDASDNVRKTKSQLMKELDEWERTQGGNANPKESQIMRKDFDGEGHAITHKSQFDDLIANARRRAKTAPKQEKERKEALNGDTQHPSNRSSEPQQPQQPREHRIPDATHAYDGNEAALLSIRAKVEEANRSKSTFTSLNPEIANASVKAAKETEQPAEPIGFQNPFSSPSRQVPMFKMPEKPVVDVESSTAIQ